MHFTSSAAQARYAALLAVRSSAVIGLDFDGTLSPIVADPAAAHIHPAGPEALIAAARAFRQVAIVTGRPAAQAVELGELDRVADAVETFDRGLIVLGQYGNERWSTPDRRTGTTAAPPGLAGFKRDLAGVLAASPAPDAWVEDKGLAVAVHTRRLADPEGAWAALQPPLTALAQRHGLGVEPGRLVLEIRGEGMDKGKAVHSLVRECGAGGFVFVGDDLGDLPAFEALLELRDQGLPTLLVCAASAEQPALQAQADVLVEGPDGVVALLSELAADTN